MTKLAPIGGRDAIFRRRLAPDAPLAGADYAARLLRQTCYTPKSSPVAGPWGEDYVVVANMSKYSIPVYMVPEGHPTQKVAYRRSDGSTPGGALQDAWMDVPVPDENLCADGRIPAIGTDESLAIVQGAKLWEFWKFEKSGDGYQAQWGGYDPNYLASSGIYANYWGVHAAGSNALSGLITWRDAELGKIEHALTVALPCTGKGASTPLSLAPFYRGDSLNLMLKGTTADLDADRIPHGTHFRIPAGFDIGGWVKQQTAAHSTINPRLMTAVATALQNYGMYVVDSTGGVVGFGWEDDRTIGTAYSPYVTKPGKWTQTKYTLRHAFRFLPWALMEQVA